MVYLGFLKKKNIVFGFKKKKHGFLPTLAYLYLIKVMRKYYLMLVSAIVQQVVMWAAEVGIFSCSFWKQDVMVHSHLIPVFKYQKNFRIFLIILFWSRKNEGKTKVGKICFWKPSSLWISLVQVSYWKRIISYLSIQTAKNNIKIFVISNK